MGDPVTFPIVVCTSTILLTLLVVHADCQVENRGWQEAVMTNFL